MLDKYRIAGFYFRNLELEVLKLGLKQNSISLWFHFKISIWKKNFNGLLFLPYQLFTMFIWNISIMHFSFWRQLPWKWGSWKNVMKLSVLKLVENAISENSYWIFRIWKASHSNSRDVSKFLYSIIAEN